MSLELPTRETIAFLERALPPAPARVLEVGAADVAVSAALTERGYRVTTLDQALDRPSSPGAERAFLERDFLYFDAEGAFDVVLFTHSLHHFSPIEDAIDRAVGALGPGGRVVAEEFAYDRVNLPTARWFYDLQLVLAAGALVTGVEEEEGNPLGRWRREHAAEPPLSTGHTILAAARERLDLSVVEEAPYLYRHVWDRLVDSEAARRAAEAVFRIERRLTRERDIAAAGLRFVGTPLE